MRAERGERHQSSGRRPVSLEADYGDLKKVRYYCRRLRLSSRSDPLFGDGKYLTRCVELPAISEPNK
jgi:hypothetical protein